jgi:CheY-like chemotaxis protein
MLNRLGVAPPIRQAADGQEAWDALQDCAFDVIVCDINMPRMNGLELLKRLRGHPDFEATPFLMITGEVAEDTVAAAVESEVDGYLLKPFRLATLESRLRAIIQGRHHPGPGDHLFLEAQRHLAAGDPDQGLKILANFLLPPHKPTAKVFTLMGLCHLARGSPLEAARRFSQALALNPFHLLAARHLDFIMVVPPGASDPVPRAKSL